MVAQEMCEFTVIITASFIPSHPSTKIIKETIDSLKYISKNQNFSIILSHDFSENPQYIEYLNNLKIYYKDNERISIYVRETHGHLVGNIRNVINYVTTRYILVVQHDLPFIKEFDIEKIIIDMDEQPAVKCLRFNKRHNLKRGIDKISYIFGHQTVCKNYTYTRTPGWSDNNHLCSTDYYKNVVLVECRDGTAMEHTLAKRSKTKPGHRKYGPYIFGPNGHEPMIKHIDGRHTK